MDELWAKMQEYQEATSELCGLVDRGWMDAEWLDRWDQVFRLQEELAPLLRQPAGRDD